MKPATLLLGSLSLTTAVPFGWRFPSCMTPKCIEGDMGDAPESSHNNANSIDSQNSVNSQNSELSDPGADNPVVTVFPTSTNAASTTVASCPMPTTKTQWLGASQGCNSLSGFGTKVLATGVAISTAPAADPTAAVTTITNDNGCDTVVVMMQGQKPCSMSNFLQKSGSRFRGPPPIPDANPLELGPDWRDRTLAYINAKQANIISSKIPFGGKATDTPSQTSTGTLVADMAAATA
ncbi:hypothetical protein BROUX41_006118 [Berkeleyomyces rouxiae]|uniref:uncharacterized protein n=1 Tax=Berkeleyomyces rouxiae TaxID=2035830 RepID=UPI003B7DA561